MSLLQLPKIIEAVNDLGQELKALKAKVESLEQQIKLAKAIKRLAKKVKPGGYLFGVWHSRDNLEGGFGGPRDPKVLPNVESISKALKGTGLMVEVLTNRDGQIQTREGLKPSITLVLLAKRESN